MSRCSNKFNFLADDEAISFICTMTKELQELVEKRRFRPLLPSLTQAEHTARAMKCAMKKARLNRLARML